MVAEKSVKEILKAKNLVLDKYNIFPMIIEIIKKIKNNARLENYTVEIKPESFFMKPNFKNKLLNIYGKSKFNLKKILN